MWQLCLVWLRTARAWEPSPVQPFLTTSPSRLLFQSLETAVENAGSASSLSAATTDISDLQTLTGIADGNSDLGTFSGSTIADNDSIKDCTAST